MSGPPQHVVLVLDTSASMNQRMSSGLLLIDCAKSAVDYIIKVRMREAASRNDVYTLIATGPSAAAGAARGNPPGAAAAPSGGSCVLAVDNKPPYSNILTALKYIDAHDMAGVSGALRVRAPRPLPPPPAAAASVRTAPPTVPAADGPARRAPPTAKHAFDWLHQSRMVSGVDCLGQGMLPYMMEPALVVLLTDTTDADALAELPAPLGRSSLPGGEYFREAFRWDHTLHALQLRMPAVAETVDGTNAAAAAYEVGARESPMASLCEETGGRCWAVGGLRPLLNTVERIATHASGVRVNIKIMSTSGHESSSSRQQGLSHRPLHFRAGSNYLWPIPEIAQGQPRPEAAAGMAPADALHHHHQQQQQQQQQVAIACPRDAHPTLLCVSTQVNGQVPGALSGDSYDLDCPALAKIMRDEGASCWQLRCFTNPERRRNEPIGLVRLARHGFALTVQILPYRYTTLIPLVEKLLAIPAASRHAPPVALRREFDRYCASCPPYYFGQLRHIMRAMGVPSSFVPEPKNALTAPQMQSLSRIRHLSRTAHERQMALVNELMAANLGRREGGRAGAGAGAAAAGAAAAPNKISSSPIFTSPFDIPRDQLLRQVSLFSTRLGAGHANNKAAAMAVAKAIGKLDEDLTTHSVPVAQMGDYMATAMRKAPPRDPRAEVSDAQFRPSFGNPFQRISASRGGNADELDEAAYERGILGGDRQADAKRARPGAPPPPPSSSSPAAPPRAREAGEKRRQPQRPDERAREEEDRAGGQERQKRRRVEAGGREERGPQGGAHAPPDRGRTEGGGGV